MNQYLGQGMHVVHRLVSDDYAVVQDRETGEEVVHVFGSEEEAWAWYEEAAAYAQLFESSGVYQ